MTAARRERHRHARARHECPCPAGALALSHSAIQPGGPVRAARVAEGCGGGRGHEVERARGGRTRARARPRCSASARACTRRPPSGIARVRARDPSAWNRRRCVGHRQRDRIESPENAFRVRRELRELKLRSGRDGEDLVSGRTAQEPALPSTVRGRAQGVASGRRRAAHAARGTAVCDLGLHRLRRRSQAGLDQGRTQRYPRHAEPLRPRHPRL